MVANKLFFIFIVSICSLVEAKTIVKPNNIDIYINNEVKTALGKLGEQIDVCHNKEKVNTLVIDPKKLQELNITIENFKVATMALDYRNNRQCIEKEENTLMYAYLLQYKIKMDDTMVEKDALKPILMSLPSDEVIEALSKYNVLPAEVKSYFEKTIGSDPFDIVKVSLPVFNAFRK